jgi:hypothetical protein
LCKAIEQRTEIGTEGTDDGEAKIEYSGIVTIDEAPVSGILLLVTGLEGFLKERMLNEALMKEILEGSKPSTSMMRSFEGSSSARAINPSARTPEENSRTQKSPFGA